MRIAVPTHPAAVQFGAMLDREVHVGQHVGFSLVHQRGKLGHTRPCLVGDLSPLRAGGYSVILGKAVPIHAETMRRCVLPAYAKALRMKGTRQRWQVAASTLAAGVVGR
jgi:hypothetical protein